jgi:hypothetical protein
MGCAVGPQQPIVTQAVHAAFAALIAEGFVSLAITRQPQRSWTVAVPLHWTMLSAGLQASAALTASSSCG